jgi:hypothetical protein
MADRWRDLEIIMVASRYQTRSQFRAEYPHGYKLALERGLMDMLYPDSANKLEKALAMYEKLGLTELRKQYPAMYRMVYRHHKKALTNIL